MRRGVPAAEIAGLYATGPTMTAIAARYRVSRDTIRPRLLTAGVTPRRAAKPIPTEGVTLRSRGAGRIPIPIEEAAQLYGSGQTLRQIADRYAGTADHDRQTKKAPRPPRIRGRPLAAGRCWHPQSMGTRYPEHGWCVAVDVHYPRPGGARAAAVLAADAAFAQVLDERTAMVPEVAPYRPGEFYRRELPPLRAVLDGIGALGLLVVDGYTDLDPCGRPGLGAHAHAEFAVPVIGVAKSAFRTAVHAIPVLRAASARPLFVTAAGMPAADAAELVRHMAGQFRVPDALRRADQLARTAPQAPTHESHRHG